MSVDPLNPRENDLVEAASSWCLKLAEGGMTPSDQRQFDAWLEVSEVHAQAFDDAVRAWRAVESASLTPEFIDMRTAALGHFRQSQRRRWGQEGTGRPARLAAISMGLALVILGASVGVWLKITPRNFETAVGERRVVVLSDGSKVSLDAATKVEVSFRSDRREIKLDYGRAKFSVAHDQRRPFTVAAGDKLVRATGTQFSVEILQDQVHVILYEGHVAVLDRSSPSRAPRSVLLQTGSKPTLAGPALTPGHELVIALASTNAAILVSDPVRSASWEGGQIVFVDEPLRSAVERINRYSDDKLVIGDATAGAALISGNFAAGDTPAFIEGATGVLPVKVRDDGGRKTLVSRDQ